MTVRLTLAVNNDTLATWLLPALAPLLVAEGLLVEFVLDNQGHAFSLLEQGLALACVSGEASPLRGCTVTPLGTMRYRMVAAPAFAARRCWKPARWSTWPRIGSWTWPCSGTPGAFSRRGWSAWGAPVAASAHAIRAENSHLVTPS